MLLLGEWCCNLGVKQNKCFDVFRGLKFLRCDAFCSIRSSFPVLCACEVGLHINLAVSYALHPNNSENWRLFLLLSVLSTELLSLTYHTIRSSQRQEISKLTYDIRPRFVPYLSIFRNYISWITWVVKVIYNRRRWQWFAVFIRFVSDLLNITINTCINKRNLLDMNLILFFFFMFYHQEVLYNISYFHGHFLSSPLCRKCEF